MEITKLPKPRKAILDLMYHVYDDIDLNQRSATDRVDALNVTKSIMEVLPCRVKHFLYSL
jgi:hypothetical protein